MIYSESQIRMILGFPPTGREDELYRYIQRLSNYDYQGGEMTGTKLMVVFKAHLAVIKKEPTEEEIRKEKESQMTLDEKRRQVSMEYLRGQYAFYKERLDNLKPNSTEEQIEWAKHSVFACKDWLNSFEKHPERKIANRSCDILIAFKERRYPEKNNPYYWNKKCQPKLRKLRDRLKMPAITKWERDSLFPMYD